MVLAGETAHHVVEFVLAEFGGRPRYGELFASTALASFDGEQSVGKPPTA